MKNYTLEELKDPNVQSLVGAELRTDFKAMTQIAQTLIALCIKKDGEYGSSWKTRGGPGAYLTAVRKFDRLEAQLKLKAYNVFDVTDDPTSTESLDETIKDAINYLLLIQETRDAIRHHIENQTLNKSAVELLGQLNGAGHTAVSSSPTIMNNTVDGSEADTDYVNQ